MQRFSKQRAHEKSIKNDASSLEAESFLEGGRNRDDGYQRHPESASGRGGSRLSVFGHTTELKKQSLTHLYNTHSLPGALEITLFILPFLPHNLNSFHKSACDKFERIALAPWVESTGKIWIDRIIHPSHFAFNANTARLCCFSIRIVNRRVDCVFPATLHPMLTGPAFIEHNMESSGEGNEFTPINKKHSIIKQVS